MVVKNTTAATTPMCPAQSEDTASSNVACDVIPWALRAMIGKHCAITSVMSAATAIAAALSSVGRARWALLRSLAQREHRTFKPSNGGGRRNTRSHSWQAIRWVDSMGVDGANRHCGRSTALHASRVEAEPIQRQCQSLAIVWTVFAGSSPMACSKAAVSLMRRLVARTVSSCAFRYCTSLDCSADAGSAPKRRREAVSLKAVRAAGGK